MADFPANVRMAKTKAVNPKEAEMRARLAQAMQRSRQADQAGGATSAAPPGSSFGQYAKDVAVDTGRQVIDHTLAGTSALRSAGEQALGTLGDIPDIKSLLLDKIASYPSSIDFKPGIENAKQTFNNAPNSEEVAAFTDRQVAKLPPQGQRVVNAFTRYEPKTMIGKGIKMGVETVADPTELIPGVGAAVKGNRMVKALSKRLR